jgi:hypothetical protein
MNPFREFSRALRDTNKLQPRYYWLTSSIGLAGVILGLASFILYSAAPASVLGIDSKAPLRDEPNGTLELFLLLLGFAVLIYLGCVCAAGCFAMFMLATGRITRGEALLYTLFSKYPASWFNSLSNAPSQFVVYPEGLRAQVGDVVTFHGDRSRVEEVIVDEVVTAFGVEEAGVMLTNESFGRVFVPASGFDEDFAFVSRGPKPNSAANG